MDRFDRNDAVRNFEESKSEERRKAHQLSDKLKQAEQVRRKLPDHMRPQFDRKVAGMMEQLSTTEKMLRRSENERIRHRQEILNRKSTNH